jgi:hypothetical protein
MRTQKINGLYRQHVRKGPGKLYFRLSSDPLENYRSIDQPKILVPLQQLPGDLVTETTPITHLPVEEFAVLIGLIGTVIQPSEKNEFYIGLYRVRGK